MVKLKTYNLTENGKANLVLTALQSDTKPTGTFGTFNIANGSKCFEIDTNKEFRYSGATDTWIAQTN